MKQLKAIAILIPLLMWGIGLCLSSSLWGSETQNPPGLIRTIAPEEQLQQEERSKSVAWSEQAAPLQTAAHAAEPLYSVLLVAYSLFLLYLWKQKPVKALRKEFSFPTLSEQFRILPNAP